MARHRRRGTAANDLAIAQNRSCDVDDHYLQADRSRDTARRCDQGRQQLDWQACRELEELVQEMVSADWELAKRDPNLSLTPDTAALRQLE